MGEFVYFGTSQSDRGGHISGILIEGVHCNVYMW